ncbi:hypothetical protein PIB30_068854 [Stylosanthes scabra]|uniref:Uncharacterized protein n=1 Tax=Stylosanthes scabra TaxID=79078 RepID=A0ABU6SNP9_9FABA|nr:hypothetical protein [Stylosanthes scabra]
MPLMLRPCQQHGDLNDIDSIRCKLHYWNVTIINVHQGFSKHVMDKVFLYDQGYTPWNPLPYQHHTPRYDAYQSNGYGDAYYGYEDPLPPYPPSQNGIEEALQLLCKERKELMEAQNKSTINNFNNSSIASEPLNSGDLLSQPLSNPRRCIGTLFLCTNQEGRQDALLLEEDVESLNHEEVNECLEKVEEENEDQEAEDVDQEVKNEDKEPKGMEIVYSASSEATPPELPSKSHFEWVHYLWESEFKAYSGHLHNNQAKIRALSMRKHLGPWQFQEKLVNSQNNGWKK